MHTDGCRVTSTSCHVTNITLKKHTVMKLLCFGFRNRIVFGRVTMAAYATLLPVSSSVRLRLDYTREI
jgi:hypothetical protein